MAAEQVKNLIAMQHNTAEQMNQMLQMISNLAASVEQQSRSIQSQSKQPQHNENLADTLSKAIDTFQPSINSTFQQWYRKYETVFTIDGEALPDDAKTRLLLRKISQEAYDKYVNIILPARPEASTFDQTVKKLGEIFSEAKSQFQKRYDCLNFEKSASEDFVTYGAMVNKMCEDFQISTITPDQFKCLMFVIGLKSPNDNDIRNRILALLEDTTRNTNLNIERLVTEAKRLITIKADAAMIQGNSVHGVKATPQAKSRKYNKANKNNVSSQQQNDKKPSSPCWGCGEMHYYIKTCPYRKQLCPDCNRVGHKSGFCNAPKPGKYRSNHVVASTTSHEFQPARKYVRVSINNQPLVLQLDNGSDFTIISEENFNKLTVNDYRLPAHSAFDASSNSINFTKEFDASVNLQGQTRTGVIKVTKNRHLNVLGSDFMNSFGLFDKPLNEVCLAVHRNFKDQVLKEFPQLFSDTPGKVTKFQPMLILRENAQPIFRPKRPVPYATMPLIEAELDRLTKLEIITPVEYSEYAAPIVAVRKKDGSVRICGDYSTGLNEQLEPCQYPLPTNEEMFSKLSGNKVFSKIDLSDAFLQVEIHPDSRKLLTITTHKGLYQFNRLAPGVKPAPGMFQQLMETILNGIPDIAILIDDILISAPDDAAHDVKAREVLKRLESHGFRVKLSKCDFHKLSLKYLGRIIDANGSRPDPDKIKAILDIQAPTDVSQLRSLLGSINYHSRYIKNLRNIRAPLDELTKKDVPWNWSLKCQQAFDDIKAILTSDLHLAHFDPSLPIIVAADASTTGLGAYLAQIYPDGSEKMVSCASRALIPAETNYSQIEKEAAGIMNAVKTFHRYIFGRPFILRTDHKPLLRIFGNKKGIPLHVANRLQRWALILMTYDYEISYVNTNDFGYVDVLSRLMQRFPLPEEDFVIAKIEEDLTARVHATTSHLPITNQQIIEATKLDPVLQKVLRMMKQGWPENKKQIKDPDLEPYWIHRSSLSEIQGIIMLQDRVVVPKKHQIDVINSLHQAHPGINRMKALARCYVYWPNIDHDITAKVQQCKPCADTAKMPTKTLLKSWPLATKPMERIHIDIGEPEKGDYYFVVVDAYSKWPEVFRTKVITTNYIIETLKEIFVRYGKPLLIVSDNGPQFVSDQFAEFCNNEGIEHLTTAYYQPQSNGEAERFIDTLKRHIKRIGSTNMNQTLQRFLEYYRSSPNKTINSKSPAELFLGRKIRIDLDLLRPTTSRMQVQNESQNQQFNQQHGAKDRQFAVGDLVQARVYNNNKQRWTDGQIVQRYGDVIYEVDIGSRKIRSHANQLRRRYYQSPVSTDDDLFQLLIDVNSEVQAVPAIQVNNETQSNNSIQQPVPLRRSTRQRRRPVYLQDYVTDYHA